MNVLDGMLLALDYGQQNGGAVSDARNCRFGIGMKPITQAELKRYLDGRYPHRTSETGRKRKVCYY